MIIENERVVVVDMETYNYIQGKVHNMIDEYEKLGISIDRGDYMSFQADIISTLIMDGYRFRKEKGRI